MSPPCACRVTKLYLDAIPSRADIRFGPCHVPVETVQQVRKALMSVKASLLSAYDDEKYQADCLKRISETLALLPPAEPEK